MLCVAVSLSAEERARVGRFLPVLPPSASVTSTVDVPLAAPFFSQEATFVEDYGEDIAAGNNVIDGITIPEYRPLYSGVLRWRGTILVPASSVPLLFWVSSVPPLRAFSTHCTWLR